MIRRFWRWLYPMVLSLALIFAGWWLSVTTAPAGAGTSVSPFTLGGIVGLAVIVVGALLPALVAWVYRHFQRRPKEQDQTSVRLEESPEGDVVA